MIGRRKLRSRKQILSSHTGQGPAAGKTAQSKRIWSQWQRGLPLYRLKLVSQVFQKKHRGARLPKCFTPPRSTSDSPLTLTISMNKLVFLAASSAAVLAANAAEPFRAPLISVDKNVRVDALEISGKKVTPK